MRRLALCALGFSTSLALAHYALPPEALLWCALLMAGLFAASFLLRGAKKRRAALICLFAALGFIWYWGYERLAVLPAQEYAGEELRVTARVTDYSSDYADYSSVYVRLTTEGLPEVKCLLYDYDGAMTDLSPGDIITSTVKLRAATERYGEETDAYTSRGVLMRGYFKAPVEVTGRWDFSFLYFPKAMARAVSQTVTEIFPRDVSPFVRAMLTGDKTEIYDDDAAYAGLTRAGIFHICAVSGMHLSFIYSFITLVAGKRLGAYITVPALWLFALMAGATPSVLRSAFMLTLVVTAPLLDREADGLTSLSAVLLLILAANPMAIGSASLQLSFGATAGIMLVSPGVYRWCAARWREDKRKNKLRAGFRRAVLASFASSMGAIAFTTPLAALRFGYVALLSPVANLLTLWAMSILFIGAYFCVLLGLTSFTIGTTAAWCFAWLARYVLFAAGAVAAVPLSVVYAKDPMVGWWLVFLYAAFIYAWVKKGKAPFRPAAPVAVGAITLCAVVLSAQIYYSLDATAMAVDVGQGACAAFFTGRDTVVVDCGGSEPPMNAGDEAAQYLLSRGRGDVDALVLTHLHEDHCSGVKRLMSLIPVRDLFLPEAAPDSDDMLDGILSAAERGGTRVHYISSDTDIAAGDISLRLFAPLGVGDENETGLLALVSMGNFDALVTGDAGSAVERELVREKQLPDCEMLFVGHHGSKYSTCHELLQALSPELAVISVGYNSYGHPTEEALSRLGMNGIEILRTDTDGTVTVRIENDG